MSDVHTEHKLLFSQLRTAMQDRDDKNLQSTLNKIISPDAAIHLCHPFGSVKGPCEYFKRAYAPLRYAFPDMERRDFILIGGSDEEGENWLGCAGHYLGVFTKPWLDIPATGHIAHMRFHEFYRFNNDKIVEVQLVWDIPSLMMQANAWPMAPSLGMELMVPSPATHDGLVKDGTDPAIAQSNKQIVLDMLAHMIKHPGEGGPEVMQMERFWHRDMNWYGPAGIGTTRGITGFRNWHQIPFLKAMPDRGQYPEKIKHHFFAESNYVAVTGWPNMAQTLLRDGWLGLAAAGQEITLRSLDFWRIENGLIRENWVLVDLLDVFHQLGIDVFNRMREMTLGTNLTTGGT